MSTGRIYLFHQGDQLRLSLERDLLEARFNVRAFDSGAELERAARSAPPILVLWDLDLRPDERVDDIERRVGALVLGLSRDRSRAASEGAGRVLVMPFERWRVAPRVKELVSAEQAPARRRGARVITDTIPRDQPRLWEHEPPDLSMLVAQARLVSPAAEERHEEQAPKAPVRVLIADDDEVLQHILSYQFEEASWSVSRALDGVTALSLLSEQTFDLVLLDLNLPHKNGFEILEVMAPRAQEHGARVVVMSEQTQDDKVIRAFGLGAHDFVRKPLNPKVVLSRFLRLLERR